MDQTIEDKRNSLIMSIHKSKKHQAEYREKVKTLLESSHEEIKRLYDDTRKLELDKLKNQRDELNNQIKELESYFYN